MTTLPTLTASAHARLGQLLAQSRARRDVALAAYAANARALISTRDDVRVVCLSYYGHHDDGAAAATAMDLPHVADLSHVGNACARALAPILRRLRVQAQVAHDAANAHDALVVAVRIARAGLRSPDAAVAAALDV